ncbi:MAG: M36 family metallopeptidase, partial [Gemmataceae bacterium]
MILEDRTLPNGVTLDPPNPHGTGCSCTLCGKSEQPPAFAALPKADGFVTGPRPGDRDTVARQTLLELAPELGITAADVLTASITDSYTSQGLSHIYFRQRHNGLDVLNGTAGVHLMPDGRAIAVNGEFVPDIAVNGGTPEAPVLSPAQAVEAAATAFGYTLKTPPVVLRDGGPNGISELLEPEFSDLPITVRRAAVNTVNGVRPVWEFSARTPDGDNWYHSAIDTADGSLDFWADWISHFGTYNVLAMPNESPSEGPREVLVNPFDPVASPFGWHDTNGAAGAEFTDTRGNNVFAQEDIDANNTGGVRPNGGTDRIFDNVFDTTQAPSTYRDAATTNLFYFNNVMHDVAYKYGFNEVSGNFQQNNYGRGGLGNDPVQADAQDGSGTNNANFGTPPDGSSPRMQMFIWTQANPDRDSDFDNGVIAHEYGHGISNRLTGGPANSSALNATQSGGMGEGWSDFFALMLTQRPTDLPNQSYGIGTYVINQPPTGTGIRSFPYSFDMTINPMTFANYGTGAGQSTAVHFAGARWNSALWDINWLLCAKYGYDSDLSTGYAPGGGPASAGNKLTMRLVLDGMKLQPVTPSFIDARNAILAADVAVTGGVNRRELWTAFARRGLGFSAATANSNDVQITEAFDLPPEFAAAPGIQSHTPSSRTTVAPSSLRFTFSEAMNAASFSIANDVASFTGPGNTNLLGSITGFNWVNATTLQVQFNAPTTPGRYTMVVGPNIQSNDNAAQLDQDFDGIAGEATQDQYTARFELDPLPLTVVAVSPSPGSAAPLGTSSIDVTFSESIAPASLTTADLQLSTGSVTGVTLLSPTQARFTVSGLGNSLESTIFASILYGAATDATGYPSEAFNWQFFTDIDTAPFPTPLTLTPAAGPYSYEGTFATPISINTPTDVDAFTITLDPQQRLTAIVSPLAGSMLIPRIRITDPNNTTSTFTATLAGRSTSLDAVATVAGQYRIEIDATSGSTGSFNLQLLLNSIVENERGGTGVDNTPATAQNLTPKIVPLTGASGLVTVAGITDINGILPVEVEPNNTFALANSASGNFTAITNSKTFQLGWTGNINSAGNSDWVSIGSLSAGSTIVITMAGSGASAGTISDSFVELWRTGSGSAVTADDDAGPSADSRIEFTIATTDTYFVRARHFDAGGTGTYRIGIRLTTATPPITGGSFAAETEENDTIATANNASGSWRQFQHQSLTTGSIPASDTDIIAYPLTAGDRMTFQVVGTAGFSPFVELLNSSQVVLQSVDSSTLTESTLHSYIIPTTGTYFLRVSAALGNGNYTVTTFLSGTAPAAPTQAVDWYQLDVPAGSATTYGLNRIGGTASITIFDATGTTQLGVTGSSTGYLQQITLFSTTATSHRIRVLSANASQYLLTVGQDSHLDLEGNNTRTTSQGFQQIAFGRISTGDEDWYSWTPSTPGSTLQVVTSTPGSGPGEFVNTLNPNIELYDSAGTLVASDDNSDPDGRNAILNFSPFTPQTYTIRVRGTAGSTGAYVLRGTVIVNAAPGNVTAGGPYIVNEGEGLTLTASATDPENDPLTFEWDTDQDGQFDDGTGSSISIDAAGMIALGLGDGPATGAVRVRVNDGKNAAVLSNSVAITVQNVAPQAKITGNTTQEGVDGQVTVTDITDVAADLSGAFRFAYDFDNDGTFEITDSANSTATVPASFLLNSGTRTVGVRVTDDDGGSRDFTGTITIQNVAPTASIVGGNTTEGSTFQLAFGPATDPSPNDTT